VLELQEWQGMEKRLKETQSHEKQVVNGVLVIILYLQTSHLKPGQKSVEPDIDRTRRFERQMRPDEARPDLV